MRKEKSFSTCRKTERLWGRANKYKMECRKRITETEGQNALLPRPRTQNSKLKTQNSKLLSLVIALFAHRQSYRQAVAPRRKRAGRVRGVRTRRILKAIEIEHEVTGFIQAVAGEARIEKAAGAICGGSACRVSQN